MQTAFCVWKIDPPIKYACERTSQPVMREKISQARILCFNVNLEAASKGPRPVNLLSLGTIIVAENW